MLLTDIVELVLPTPLHAWVALLGAGAWAALVKVRGRRMSRALWVAWACAFGWTTVCLLPAFADHWIARLEGPVDAVHPAPARDPHTLIVVLSSGEMTSPSGQPRARLTRDGWERVHGAVGLWRRTGGTLVFTGGPDGAADRSIAAHAASIAIELGVPAQAVVVSASGSNTREELAAVAAHTQGGGGPRWLVTSAVHMPRAQVAARAAGLDLAPHPVGHLQIRDHGWWEWVPTNAAVGRLGIALHELAGVVAYRARDAARARGADASDRFGMHSAERAARGGPMD
jgi:uncharacterized SAM-binding protein YcdF (DUF218 family)